MANAFRSSEVALDTAARSCWPLTIMRRLLAAGLLLSSPLVLLAACGDDAADGGSGGETECHCDFGDVCTEYAEGCATRACSSSGQDVKGDGGCDTAGAIARCVCNDANDLYTEYYFEGEIDALREECEFFCESPSFEEL
jgi:hypothetical protein